MNFKTISFQNANGETLSGRLDLPLGAVPDAYARFAHCFTCSKHTKAVAAVSHALTRKGIAVLRFDFTGLGDSQGDFSDTTFSSNVADLITAAGYLAANYAAPKILIGHSFGGTACLKAASHLPGVKAVATIGSPFDPAHVQHLLGDARNKIADRPPAGEHRVVTRIGRSGYRTEITAGSHRLVADEPADVGGTDTGPAPYDLLAAGLGACTAITLRMYADRKDWPLETVTVSLVHRKVDAAACRDCETRTGNVDRIERAIDMTGPLNVEQRQRLMEIADRCPVHRTLHGQIEVVTTEELPVDDMES